ncbi:hypothetical protein [Alicyclobacillus cellulosilyticus]|nr:hypothetical protein [Alicyclobacillus cellulosilyticus]
MTLPWWLIGSIILNSILVILFLTGGFFMMRAFLRQWRNRQD